MSIQRIFSSKWLATGFAYVILFSAIISQKILMGLLVSLSIRFPSKDLVASRMFAREFLDVQMSIIMPFEVKRASES
jgi:hypothetical protein